MYAPQAAFFSELFGTEVRYTGASIGYQLASPLAGGLRCFSAPTPKQGVSKVQPKAFLFAGLGLAPGSMIGNVEFDFSPF